MYIHLVSVIKNSRILSRSISWI